MEFAMTIRFLAAVTSIAAACLTSTAIPCRSGELAADQAAPFAVAAAQNAAPNFAGISNWFNSAPLNIADLRGKVVLVDFWTYGCVNCVNTLPHVTEPSSMRNTGIAALSSSASTRRNSRSSDRYTTCRPC